MVQGKLDTESLNTINRNNTVITIKSIFNMRYMRLVCDKLKSNVLQNREVTIVTIHNYGKVYEVEGNVSF